MQAGVGADPAEVAVARVSGDKAYQFVFVAAARTGTADLVSGSTLPI